MVNFSVAKQHRKKEKKVVNGKLAEEQKLGVRNLRKFLQHKNLVHFVSERKGQREIIKFFFIFFFYFFYFNKHNADLLT